MTLVYSIPLLCQRWRVQNVFCFLPSNIAQTALRLTCRQGEFFISYYYCQFLIVILHKLMNKYVVIVALINGMIGGLILVLPILAMQAGSVLSLLIILATGFFSFYSCYLCIIHLGDCSDFDKALLEHFNQKRIVSIFYNFLVFFGMMLLLMQYFNLIVTQWRGLLPYNLANPICNALALITLTFLLNYFHFGAKLLGYGIISIVGYCIFLVWLVSSAPQGPNIEPQFGRGAVNLAASMGQAFSIQGFFIPVLKQLPESNRYVRYVLIAYVVGGTVYLYIAFAGSFGLLNRPTVPPGIVPQTIENYFSQDQWQVGIVQAIYLVHLYSAYGQFLLICKKRFFAIFNIKQSKQGHILNIPEIIFVLILVGITVGIYFGNVSIQTLIQINGAILGFFFIYFLPALMHFVCLYYPGRKQLKIAPDADTLQTELKQFEMLEAPTLMVPKNKQSLESNEHPSVAVPINTDKQPDLNQSHLSKISSLSEQNQKAPRQRLNKQVYKSNFNDDLLIKQMKKSGVNFFFFKNYVTCGCKKQKPLIQFFDLLAMFGMVGLGAFIMVDGFIGIITGE